MADEPVQDYHFIRSLPNPSQGENAYALLHEIVACLQTLLTDGEPSRIDLQAIPLGEEDATLLRENLGEGPIQAEVADEGYVQIIETAIAGVWWLVELDEDEQVLAEYLEINFTPEVLQISAELVEDGRSALQARLFQLGLENSKTKPSDP